MLFPFWASIKKVVNCIDTYNILSNLPLKCLILMIYWFIHQKKHLKYWKCFQLVTFAVDIIGTWENLPVNKNKWPWSSFCPSKINRERKTRKFRAISSSIYQIEKLFFNIFKIPIFPHNFENELNLIASA